MELGRLCDGWQVAEAAVLRVGHRGPSMGVGCLAPAQMRTVGVTSLGKRWSCASDPADQWQHSQVPRTLACEPPDFRHVPPCCKPAQACPPRAPPDPQPGRPGQHWCHPHPHGHTLALHHVPGPPRPELESGCDTMPGFCAAHFQDHHACRRVAVSPHVCRQVRCQMGGGGLAAGGQLRFHRIRAVAVGPPVARAARPPQLL